MSVATDKTSEQGKEISPYPGAPIVKDVWTVAGDYTPKFKIKGCVLTKAGSTEADLNYKLKLDDTADVVTLATNIIQPCGDVISALQANTTADSVTFYG